MEIASELKLILQDESLSKEDKEQLIKKYYRQEYKKLDEELIMHILKLLLGEAFLIGSAAIPILGEEKLGTSIIKNILTSKIGKKLASNISSGIVSGYASGSLFGAGNAILDDKNILETTLEDGILGSLYGGILGGSGAYVERYLRGRALKAYGDLDELSKSVRKKFFKEAKAFYKDYIQGIIVYKDGKISFSDRGLREILKWNPKQSKNFPELIDDIKNAKYLYSEPNYESKKIGKVVRYDIYRGSYGRYKVEVLNDKNNSRRYYFTNDDSVSGDSTTSRAHDEIVPLGTFSSSNNIINDNSKNVNPSSGQKKILESRVEMNVTDNNRISKAQQNIESGSDVKFFADRLSEIEKQGYAELEQSNNYTQEPEIFSKKLEDSELEKLKSGQVPITYTINRVKREYPPSPLVLREQIEDVIYDVLDDFCRYKGFNGRNDY